VARGKRAGARPRRRFRPALLLLALGITAAVVAWGYLVYAAIDFGSTAREGDSEAWRWLGVAAAGAVACLFVGLMLVARLARAIGLTSGPQPKAPKGPKQPKEDEPPKGSSSSPPGGRRRAAR
jgi:hypothetical protein